MKTKILKFIVSVLVVALLVAIAVIYYLDAPDAANLNYVTNSAPRSEISSAEAVPMHTRDASKASLPSLQLQMSKLDVKPELFTKPALQKWQNYRDTIDVAIRGIPPPQEYSLAFRPTAGQHYRYLGISSVSVGSNDENLMHFVTDSEVATGLNEAGEVVLDVEKKSPWALRSGASIPDESLSPASTIQMISRGGNLYRRSQGDETEQVQYDEADRELFLFDLPENIAPKMGETWTSQKKIGPLISKESHYFAGFADVGGVCTAKIVSDGILEVDTAKMTAMDTKGQFQVSALSGGDFRRQTTTYVSIDTGMVIRSEMRITASMGPVSTNTTAISQCLPISAN